jgi:hypothetical protein
VLIICGFFPAAAVALMFVRAALHGEDDPRVRACLAVTALLTVWLVLEVGVFASYYSDRIVERNLIALAPVLFVGFVVWLERGVPGMLVERGAVATVAAVVLLVLPVRRLVNDLGIHDAMTMVPLYKLRQATGPGTLLAVYLVVAALVALAFALLPRRSLRMVPGVLLVALVAASALAGKFVVVSGRKPTLVGAPPLFGARQPSWALLWS